jgi:hypothetical protein
MRSRNNEEQDAEIYVPARDFALLDCMERCAADQERMPTLLKRHLEPLPTKARVVVQQARRGALPRNAFVQSVGEVGDEKSRVVSCTVSD